MQVGDLLLEDGELDAIERCHRESAFDFRMPELKSNPLFVIQRSLRHEGKFLAAVLGKVEVEVFLFLNREASTPYQRFEGLKLLHCDLVRKAREFGFDSMYCVLPPQVEKSFGPRLEEHGWRRDRGWTKYTYEL